MSKNKNDIEINENRIIATISECLESMNEVSRQVSSGFTESITHNVLGRDTQNQGIKISIDNNNLDINLSINVYYGVNIPQLCYDIQSNIKRLLENEFSISIKSINVKIEGVDITED